MVILFLMLMGSGIWFLSDGYIRWPAEAERHAVYKDMAEKMIADGKAKDLKDPAVKLAWEELAPQREWPLTVPKPRTPGDLAGQRWPGWIFFISATLFAGWVAWSHTLSVRAEGDWVTGAGGERVHLDSIVEMDRRKWADKGIAYALYETEGKVRRLTLDDHKFIGCEAIILEAEKRIAARAATAKPSDSGETTGSPA